MSWVVYDNWDRLVNAVRRSEEERRILYYESPSSCSSVSDYEDGSDTEDEEENLNQVIFGPWIETDTEDEEDKPIEEILVHEEKKPIEEILVHEEEKPIEEILVHEEKKPIEEILVHEEEKPIQEILVPLIRLAHRAIISALEAKYFKPKNVELAGQVTHLSQLLRDAACLSNTTATSDAVSDLLIRRMSIEVTKTLDSALTLARECGGEKTNVLSMHAAFKEVSALLDYSLADIRWALSTFNQDSDNYRINSVLPPMAEKDLILAWVRAFIAAVHMGIAEAAHELAFLARDSDWNKRIIVREKGIPALSKMLKESGNLDAAASALCNLADNQDRVREIAESLGVQFVAKALLEVPMKVQILLANLVSRMSEMDANVQEEFGRDHVMRPLVSLLGMDMDLEEFKEVNSEKATDSLNSLVLINKEMTEKDVSDFGTGNSLDGSRHQRKEKERETESPKVKLSLKVSCARALWKLAKGSLLNSWKITETKALLVLAKLMEKEEGELKKNCLMVVMELAAVAEYDADLKRAAFRPNTAAAKFVLDQLLGVINEDTGAPYVTWAIKAIGCLASVFPAKEKRIVQSLVTQLGHRKPSVTTEAAKALGKFVCINNYNCKEHSQAIIEFNGMQKLMSSLRSNEGELLHLHELILLCHLVINAGNSKAFPQAQTLSVLEGAAQHAVNQNPDLRELFAMAIHHLTIYQAGAHTNSQAWGL